MRVARIWDRSVNKRSGEDQALACWETAMLLRESESCTVSEYRGKVYYLMPGTYLHGTHFPFVSNAVPGKPDSTTNTNVLPASLSRWLCLRSRSDHIYTYPYFNTLDCKSNYWRGVYDFLILIPNRCPATLDPVYLWEHSLVGRSVTPCELLYFSCWCLDFVTYLIFAFSTYITQTQKMNQ